MSSSCSNHSHRPTHRHFLTMSWAPCTGTSQPVRRDDSHFTGGETAAQTSPEVGQGTHLASAGAKFKSRLPGVRPLRINRIIAVTVQGWHAACWRDTCRRHLMTDTHLPFFPKRTNKDTFLSLMSHHPGLQADLCSFPSNVPRLFPPQGTIPSLTEMCLFSLCSSLTLNLAFRYGVRGHTLTQVRSFLHTTYTHGILPLALLAFTRDCLYFCNYLVIVCFSHYTYIPHKDRDHIYICYI